MPCVPACLSYYYTGHSLLTSSFVKSQSGSFRPGVRLADPGANVVAEQTATGQYATVSCFTP